MLVSLLSKSIIVNDIANNYFTTVKEKRLKLYILAALHVNNTP